MSKIFSGNDVPQCIEEHNTNGMFYLSLSLSRPPTEVLDLNSFFQFPSIQRHHALTLPKSLPSCNSKSNRLLRDLVTKASHMRPYQISIRSSFPFDALPCLSSCPLTLHLQSSHTIQIGTTPRTSFQIRLHVVIHVRHFAVDH